MKDDELEREISEIKFYLLITTLMRSDYAWVSKESIQETERLLAKWKTEFFATAKKLEAK